MEARRYIPQYTAADYQTWEGEWELWQGVPVSMSPAPGRVHQRVAGRMFRMIQGQLESNDACHCEALYEVDWHIGNDTVVRPDLLIECEPNDRPIVVRPPALIVEVLSTATRQRDLTAKRDLYQSQGVSHYLIADPDEQSLQVLSLRGGTYTPVDPHKPINLHDNCGLTATFDGLWA